MGSQTHSLSSQLLAGLFVALATIILAGCDKNNSQPPPTLPVVTTTALSNITSSSATSGGTIVSDGGATVTATGIVWSKTNATPTIADSSVATTATNGTFSINLSNLEFSTVYYIRAFAANSVGNGYGEVLTLNTTNDTSKVRFTYNGEEVIYGIIVSQASGRKWLDRNLGATRVATAVNDYQAYGDLFQWGRPADGHQLMNWTSSTTGKPINGISTKVATSDIPGHSNFIMPPYTQPIDWRDNNNHNRWATNPQGPCPGGWHVPTLDEWAGETSNINAQGNWNPFGKAASNGLNTSGSGFILLKLTSAGIRAVDGPGSWNFYQVGNSGLYWSTSEEISQEHGTSKATNFQLGPDFFQALGGYKSAAASVRCIKD